MIEARTAAAARIAMEDERPDVTVIDINLPDGSGLDLTREFVVRDPNARIVVFSMSDTPMLAIQAIECGAKGYVSKNGNPFDLRDAVLAVARANDISVSYKTVAADCAMLRTKLNARTSSEMVRIAVELKLV